jgi:hypothetical protein
VLHPEYLNLQKRKLFLMHMKRHHVTSSMAVSVGFDPDTSTLEIEFHSGEIWQYHRVTEDMYNEMMSGSIGKYFQEYIKGNCIEVKVREAR